MKINTFDVKYTSYRLGDENYTETKRFSTKELMDEYFDKLFNEYNSNEKLSIESSNEISFEFNDGGKWSYEVSKEESEIIIYESLSEIKYL